MKRTTSMRRTFRFGSLFAIACLAATACGGGNDTTTGSADDTAAAADSNDSSAEPAGGGESSAGTGTLRMAPTTFVQTFDPALAQNAQIYYLQPVYDTLLKLDENQEPQPNVAESWEWDGTTATLTLREGPAFHDGTPITADAVKQNIERFNAAQGPNSQTYVGLDTVEAPDERTVVLNFTAPSPTLLTDLAQGPGMIMNPAAFDDPSLDTKPAGTSGPYELDPETSASGESYQYLAADGYWDPSRQASAAIDITAIPDEAARSNALRNGEVDVAGVGYATVDQFKAEGFEVSSRLGYLWYAMVFDRDGTKEPALADPQVRRAMAMAIDREAIAEGVFFGYATPTPQPYLEGELGHVPGLGDDLAYDPEAAKALLAEAGYADGFSLEVTSIPSTQTFQQAVANYWTDIGIETTLVSQQAGSQAEANRSGEFLVFPTPSAIGDPNNWYRSFWSDTAPYNAKWGVVDETIEKAATAGASSVDAEERQAGYADLMTHVVEEGIFIPAVRGEQIAVHPDNVDGVQWYVNEFFPNPIGISVEGG